eukprot:scaffold64935_cov31-Cyclotella_meneghiniana.AAC.7
MNRVFGSLFTSMSKPTRCHIYAQIGEHCKGSYCGEKEEKRQKGEHKSDLAKYNVAAVASFSRDHINYQSPVKYHIHQERPTMLAEVVVGNRAEAERMMHNITKLKVKWLQDVIGKTIDPILILVKEISNCE